MMFRFAQINLWQQNIIIEIGGNSLILQLTSYDLKIGGFHFFLKE